MFLEHLVMLLGLAATGFARQVSISVDASNPVGPYVAINGFFGCDEPNYAYYPEGQAMIKEIGALGKYQTYFRTHNLLTTGQPELVGVPGLKFGSTNAYTEDSDGNPIYNFTIIDRIFDSYLAGGVKPYLEVGFMPLALATNPYPYFFNFTPSSNPNVIYTGWSHVPTSYQRWEELVYQWANHCLERYGEDEVNSWYFEIWNEPNIACKLRPAARISNERLT
jgi:xylan 1,4-beta-xylosidase